MKKHQRLTVAAATFSLFTVVTLAGCSNGEATASVDENCVPAFGEFSTVTDGALEISTYDGMPYYGEGTEGAEGIDVDFLNEFAAASCLNPVWTVSPSAAVIQSVASGRTDIAAGGWYATPERGEITSLSDSIYLEVPAIFSESGTDDIEDLRGAKVGTVTGYLWVDELKAVAGDLSEYQSSDAALTDLAQGRIDYAVLGSIDAPYLLTITPTFSELRSAIMAPTPEVESSQVPQLPNYPHTKGNEELTQALNAAITEAHESGRFAEIVATYGLDAGIVDLSKYETE